MTYCSTADIRDYLGLGAAGDDTLIAALITRAQKWIDTYTGRTFASATGTHRFTVGKDTDGPVLLFDTDCIAITTVTNKADASSPETISSTEYTTLPRNRTPYYGIRLKDSSDKSWDYANDAEMGVTVAGDWAYSTTAPADVVHACVRLAAHMYKLKDAQVFDVTAIPESGEIVIPKGIPADVKLILEPYVQKVVVW